MLTRKFCDVSKEDKRVLFFSESSDFNIACLENISFFFQISISFLQLNAGKIFHYLGKYVYCCGFKRIYWEEVSVVMVR